MANQAVLQATDTKTANWTGGWVDFGGNQDRWKFLLTVASFTGSGTTDTVIVEGSRDNNVAGFTTLLGTFATNNGNVTDQEVEVDLASIADCRFIRARGTVNLVKATGTLTMSGVFIDQDTIVLGDGAAEETYTFVTALSTGPDVPFEVLIGADTEETLLNLQAAVNGGAGEGTTYSNGTTAHTTMEVSATDATTATFLALAGGTGGNSEDTVATGLTNGSFGGATLAGGVNHSSSVTVEHQSINASHNANQDGTQT